ncbi:VOC family protein [Dactylosporangium fulvum]|uniref:VOC family protein n=1 Tax=Dactylosporangium fulvum TaxID=53359 RepID=A0ABY5VX71_9ACTN|nr:VOC family protein [Dactylosporangium fulvum]UWP82388.1 VOC family protein [Dactylosporangium fulvum]
MDQRVSVITLGVADVRRSQRFYEALGWRLDDGVDDATDQIAFFQAGGLIVSLWDRARLAADGMVPDRGSWAGVTLGYSVVSPEEVDHVLGEAQAAGGTITRPAKQMFWGGYSGVFADPDGHPWEILHNPEWTLHNDGSVSLQRPGQQQGPGPRLTPVV